jgi:AhpD family alkylhydroperoxidase
VDVVISNCVINLSPDKAQVWREIARVLKPGGRVAVSDLALLKPLPPSVAQMVEALVGCVAGAVLVSETERMAKEAGLVNINLKGKSGVVDNMAEWKDPLYQKILAHLPPDSKLGDYITSLEITAGKAVQTATDFCPNAEPKRTLEVFDPAMCCSTGVCGPDVDPKLVQFAADLKWLEEQGVEVRRFNLGQNPAVFVENELVKTTLNNKGEGALPLTLVKGQIMAMGHYPERNQMVEWLGISRDETVLFTPAVAELVAIGAAIAANCEPCLKYHYCEAQRLGVSKADMASAVRKAAGVKDSPHQAILRLADKLTETCLGNPAAASDPCCGEKNRSAKPMSASGVKTHCCG